MAKRLIDTNLWNNEEIIENFTAEDKYFWLYLLTSPHNTLCGVFKNSPNLIARDMGLHKDTIVNLLYRFEKVHNLIFVDKGTNEIIILNWYKFNWTKSPKLLTMIQKEACELKSEKIIHLLQERLSLVFTDNDNDTVSIGYAYPTNSNTNNNIVDSDKINFYFDKVYSIYPRKVSKVQAKETFSHKLIGLENEEAHKKAIAIYRMLESQNTVWQNENNGEGRKIEHTPYFSSWLNDNVEDSKFYKRGKKR